MIKIKNSFIRVKKLLKNLGASGESISEKTIKSGFWVFFLRISNRLFQFIRTIVLARLLSPDDIGVFGIALVLLSMLETFSKTGFNHALIYKKGKAEGYLDTAWTVGLIRGVLIAVLLFFLGRPASIFFNSPDSMNIIRVIGIVVLLQSLSNVAVIYFEKDLEFQKYFQYRFTATIADMVVAITSVIILRNVWALALGLIAGNIVQLIMSYTISPYRPKIRFDRKKAKELFRFGKWIFLSSSLVFLITDADDLFVGKILGAAMLGYYQLAYKISNISATEVSSVISTLSFPVYAKLQDDLVKLKKAFLKILQFTTFISFPIAGAIIAFSYDFTKIFLGDKWLPMVPSIIVLAVWGAIRSIGATSGEFFKGIGRPDISTKLYILQVVIIFSLIYYFSSKWGILGTSIVILTSAVIMNAIRNQIIIKKLKCSFWDYYKSIAFASAISLVPLIVILLFNKYIFLEVSVINFIIKILIFLVVFSVNIFLINRYSSYKISLMVEELRDKIKA
jgi:lipopolysaccharide exporter